MTTEKPQPVQRSFTGESARRLLRTARTGTLGTLNRDDGGPYVSLVNVATDHAGHPLILISKLAWHTQNLASNTRASLLAAEIPVHGDSLTGPRVTVMGSLEQADPELVRHRYLARHPEAKVYAEFADFSYWVLKPERVHAVAGFGRIETLPASEVFLDRAEWPAIEASAVQHMNDDHRDAIQLYATKLLGAAAGKWTVAAIDPDGCDLMSSTGILRLPFDETVQSADGLRTAFVQLSKQAR